MSRYTIHQDWCHVSHDGPCLREDQRGYAHVTELDAAPSLPGEHSAKAIITALSARPSEARAGELEELATAAADYFDERNVPAILGGFGYREAVAAQEARSARVRKALAALAPRPTTPETNDA